MSQESLDSELSYYTVDQVLSDAKRQGLQLGYESALAFTRQGYYFLAGHRSSDWRAVHEWCDEHLEHFNWAGSTFGFLTEEDAAMFKLR